MLIVLTKSSKDSIIELNTAIEKNANRNKNKSIKSVLMISYWWMKRKKYEEYEENEEKKCVLCVVCIIK